MDVLLPRTLAEALDVKAAHPDVVPIAGGTDLMVDLNFDRRRPGSLMDISRLPELAVWRREDGHLFLGAGLTYTRIIGDLAAFGPLVDACRTVGSPQIRNRGTVGGNLGTASPAGDALPVLAAYDADVVLISAAGTRILPWGEFLIGPKRSALRPDELVLGARWRIVRGPGSFSKVGPRNAMVIAVASLCLVVDEDRREVRAALGSVGPTILRARAAEQEIARALESAGVWDDPAAAVPREAVERFQSAVAAAARPIDDVRGSAAYRRHACGVLARRALSWALQDRRTAAGAPPAR
ncbi:MAG: xanthine dehydrogenase family protein subunit M [Bacillati bacterium ANGP1]|uniref:Xanthine dehydrogenase family protein subunit M n=1 Tax=Candidatus Segetimicrobium genomatis TaxID=2569760 RepID=A0A537JX47_9BACT|nr:MAG: xanthine dehydrogenase family protein subunit M [Terrabacteria group bacterium ANGP1]